MMPCASSPHGWPRRSNERHKMPSMKPRIYVETSVISYLTARPSRDLITAAHQELTRQWWSVAQDHIDLVVSQFVVDEAKLGDAQAAKQRMALLEGLPLIGLDIRSQQLAQTLLSRGALPRKALYDALHVAACAIEAVDILVTWNCKHIANVTKYNVIEAACLDAGFKAPRICTPVELWGM
jgi:predicted nucleic acid-binding protein